MSKHHKKENYSGEGVKLVGSLDELIHLIIKDPQEQMWASDELTNKGPVHKQVLSALLLKRLYQLVKTIEKSSGATFLLQDGYELRLEDHKDVQVLPVKMPVNLGSNFDEQKIADAIAHAPVHEVLAYAMCLQVIEWSIKAAV